MRFPNAVCSSLYDCSYGKFANNNSKSSILFKCNNRREIWASIAIYQFRVKHDSYVLELTRLISLRLLQRNKYCMWWNVLFHITIAKSWARKKEKKKQRKRIAPLKSRENLTNWIVYLRGKLPSDNFWCCDYLFKWSNIQLLKSQQPESVWEHELRSRKKVIFWRSTIPVD